MLRYAQTARWLEMNTTDAMDLTERKPYRIMGVKNMTWKTEHRSGISLAK